MLGRPARRTTRRQAFLTLPTSCERRRLHYAAAPTPGSSPGTWVGDNAISRDAEGNPQGLGRCDRVDFATTSFSQPTTEQGLLGDRL